MQYIKNLDIRHPECITHRAFTILDVMRCIKYPNAYFYRTIFRRTVLKTKYKKRQRHINIFSSNSISCVYTVHRLRHGVMRRQCLLVYFVLRFSFLAPSPFIHQPHIGSTTILLVSRVGVILCITHIHTTTHAQV